ncbi:hypothetical protein OP10G_4178 [Fimbriimonas ginsengisoli Gsoil 348]|uniref:Uncharacterized protein n=1 Tax=Fimbriimonas ginsengisoli Gsoil 348 TaxID=661478 RepID=A0A068NVW0_FIMGI|nr:hypothetical protein OP10G_4178 [Fimbriimonas ginsengisoli Gsoil 348]
MPGLSAFPETNVRTYVHRNGQDPGVWFFSLDAANRIACAIARRFFGLPYFHANMQVLEERNIRRYVSNRYSAPNSLSRISSVLGGRLPDAQPGTLEFFLIERYLLYTVRRGLLMSGRVHHSPYPLREAKLEGIDEKPVGSAEIRPEPFVHVMGSDGVDVKIYPLEPI